MAASSYYNTSIGQPRAFRELPSCYSSFISLPLTDSLALPIQTHVANHARLTWPSTSIIHSITGSLYPPGIVDQWEPCIQLHFGESAGVAPIQKSPPGHVHGGKSVDVALLNNLIKTSPPKQIKPNTATHASPSRLVHLSGSTEVSPPN